MPEFYCPKCGKKIFIAPFVVKALGDKISYFCSDCKPKEEE